VSAAAMAVAANGTTVGVVVVGTVLLLQCLVCVFSRLCLGEVPSVGGRFVLFRRVLSSSCARLSRYCVYW